MTTNSVKIKAYSQASLSAKALADSLGILRLRQSSNWVNRAGRTLICWGRVELTPNLEGGRVINPPSATAVVSNKLTLFRHAESLGKGDSVVPWTTDFNVALEWLSNKSLVFGRKTLTGSSGEGIVQMSYDDPSGWDSSCPLYTMYIPKKSEWRVHKLFGRIEDVQQKKRRAGMEPGPEDFRIQNHTNGFVFARAGVNPPQKVLDVVNDFSVGYLDMGAYDVIYNERSDRAYILEINSAPGLIGTTLETYTKVLKDTLSI